MTSQTTHFLRSAGLRVTTQRRSILAVLDAADRPLSVEEVRVRMQENSSGVPTIYRTLESFVQQGWVESMLGNDQVMRFVRCRCQGHHHHLQCENCGRMVELEGCGLNTNLASRAKQSGFRITRHQLQLFGLCGDCQQAEK